MIENGGIVRVLVFGSSGQTGSYLVEKLLSEKHEVIGVARSTFPYFLPNREKFTEVMVDPTDSTILKQLLDRFDFDAVVNFLSISSVAACSENPELSRRVNFEFARLLFELVSNKASRNKIKIRLVQASSSEMYGGYPVGTSVDESLAPSPVSKYGEDKFLAHSYLNEIRGENPNIFATSLILFNHESPRRNQKFVTRKIVDRVFDISKGKESSLILGDIEVQRDWGYAKDFAEGIYRVVRAETNSDYVIGTGKLRSVRDFCIEMFENFGVAENRRIILCDESLKRSRNNNGLAGNSNLLESEIGWRPTVEFEELVKILADAKVKGQNAGS